jgi:FlaG/FlaF family flagellin (archaellin)
VTMRKFMTLLAVFAAITLSAGLSRGDVLGPDNCGSCFGSSYLLQYDPNNTTTVGADTVYDVFLTIDGTGYTGAGSFINSVAIKIASSEDTPPSSLVNAPGGAGVWSFQGGGLNASGCDGAGSGFICAQDSDHAPVPGGPYTWEFHYATTASLLTGSLASSVKVLYTEDAAGLLQAGITSEGITLQPCGEGTTETCGGGGATTGTTTGTTTGSTAGQTTGGTIPEPASLILLGSALFATFAASRRKFNRS